MIQDPHTNGLSIFAQPWNQGISTWQNIAATSGTDTACTNGTIYYGNIFIPGNMRITGVEYVIGSVGGTDKVIASVHDVNGTLLANSAAAGATVGTTATIQQVALSAVYVAAGPSYLLLGLTFNGTTGKFRTIPAVCNISGILGGSATQTFGTPASFTVSATKFTADVVPVMGVYKQPHPHMDNGNLGVNLLYTYAGNPTGVSTQAFNPPIGSIVVDTVNFALWQKTTTDNTTYTGNTGNTFTAPVIVGLTASGSTANDFSGSTGTFKTSTGAGTLSGTTNIAANKNLTCSAGTTALDLSLGTGVTKTTSGLNTFGGKASFKVIATPVAAAASPAALGSANILNITSDGATKGVTLTAGAAGDLVLIINGSGTAAQLTPATGGTINGLSANAAVVIPASTGTLAACNATNTWITFDMTAKSTAV